MTYILYKQAIVEIFVLLLTLMLVYSFAVKNCTEGLFLHVLPETNEERCCIVVPIRRGEEFEICDKDGESDRVRPCPQGLYQPDNTNSSSEVTCIAPTQCIEGENVESEMCRDGYCQKECICNVKAGKCGKFYYQCEDIPTNCSENKVHPNCSCVIKPEDVYIVSSLDISSQGTANQRDSNKRNRSKSRKRKEKKKKGKERKKNLYSPKQKKKLKLTQNKKKINFEFDSMKTAPSQSIKKADKKRHKRRKQKMIKSDRCQNQFVLCMKEN